MRAWTLLANAKGRYSRGSSETILDQDLAIIRDGGGPPELIERLRQQVGRLEVVPADLEGRNQRSAIFKTMFLAFRAKGAKDWRSNLAIAPSHSGSQHQLQFHHIFPKAVLRSRYGRKEQDDIANLAFIAGRTNQSLGATEPHKYILEAVERTGDGCFAAQAIPTELEVLTLDAYPQFLAERRRRVSEELNRFLGGAEASA